MRIIISPAKKMNVDTDSFAVQNLPQFLPETEQLLTALQAMSDKDLQSLWKCNDALAKLNVERLRTMDLHNRLTPAILAYEGIQYRYMAPGVFEDGHFDYVQEHLRILSGFCGLLRPFDGVTPYRLEMQAKLPVNSCKDLYEFWRGTVLLPGERDKYGIGLPVGRHSALILGRLCWGWGPALLQVHGFPSGFSIRAIAFPVLPV